MATSTSARGHGIETYRARRDFQVTAEPPPAADQHPGEAPIFVVQKHVARRLHWDFRLEHGGVLWSWAVPKGPSLDPGDKRLAVHVEDHPLDYAGFEGRIPAGQYGAGTVETWDRGTWQPLGDAEDGLRRGELKFRLAGGRLQGGFVLVRLKPRPGERGENWLLIKEHDAAERPGADAAALETEPLPRPPRRQAAPPVAGAVRGTMPDSPAPQLATVVEEPPAGAGWISEVKFDGYRLLVVIADGGVRLITRNGLDWSPRLPRVATLFAPLKVQALIDGELVALRADGVSSFADLQAALAEGRDGGLYFYAFDLLHLDGWDLRPAALHDRKAALRPLLGSAEGRLRFSDHLDGSPDGMRRRACELGLEGIICKRADAPYRPGRGGDWVKVKCHGREEFIVLGWTPPAGSRAGLGSLHVGYHDPAGRLHYAGGVGSGFSDQELRTLRRRLEALRAPSPAGLLHGEEPPERRITWVRPELVIEVQHLGFGGGGRVRHGVYLGLREDKAAAEVVRKPPEPDLPRREWRPATRTRIVHAAPAAKQQARPMPHIAPAKHDAERAGIMLSHADKPLWPGISKLDLADYWLAVAPHALPEIAGRPLALVRCPDGIDGQHFFQKHGHAGVPPQLHEGAAEDAPYLAIDDAAGLIACVQMAAIELHGWGAAGTAPLRADRVVFDLDPGEGIAFAQVVAAAQEVRQRLAAAGLAAFCRTTGGKGLHVVAPLVPRALWPEVRDWCHGFARQMEADSPDRFVSSVPKRKRVGRILVDWLRNGLGSTAVVSFSPRARPGAGVATPLAWREVTAALDPAHHTLRTVPARLKRQRRNPWDGFAEAARPLPGSR